MNAQPDNDRLLTYAETCEFIAANSVGITAKEVANSTCTDKEVFEWADNIRANQVKETVKVQHFTATILHHYGKQQNLTTEQGNALALRIDRNGHLAARSLGVDVAMAGFCNRLASSPNYEIWGIENAADEECQPNPTGSAAFTRLTGIECTEKEMLLGPILIIEA